MLYFIISLKKKLKAAKYIKLETSDPNDSRQTIKHTPDGLRYLEVVDKCSDRIAFLDRELGKNIIKLASSNEIDTLLVYTISFLGKNGLDILNTIKTLIILNINIKAEKEGLETLNADGSINNSILTLVNMMSSIYEHEKNIKIQKQKKGIIFAKQKGVYESNGGYKPKLSYSEFINKEKNKNCLIELQKGESIRKSAELSGVSLGTSVKVKKLAEENGDL